MASGTVVDVILSALYVSFGGLLLKLLADPRHVVELSVDNRVYLLIRKVEK